ncbi:hypothetical protein H0A36_14140 [Endozoicomonas sp. SM1973]|uniref:Phosphoesterase n=1 Tax=Spartinivicinus marinus TaxID=2994442 RepID=A0A853ICB7_9GAMM|nr:alkaline phosphatase family protein [Spartinivicinus marinus]MCX4028580.1 hypothetical protein [Spartinivicinus marinus]NYZ67157.1 hypothetical protein [Spartinivicinus marinus]
MDRYPLDCFDHVVVLMLENRSFDNLLGLLYQEGVPRDKQFSGLQDIHFSNPIPSRAANGCYQSVDFYTEINDSVAYHQPFPDPGEVYQHVNTQLYNHINEENIGVTEEVMQPPFNLPSSHSTPSMKGFVNDYINTLQVQCEYQPLPTYNDYKVIMQCFTPKQVNVLATLAKEFSVFDHWHSSVPSQTWCNRAFWHAASSGGLVLNPTVISAKNQHQDTIPATTNHPQTTTNTTTSTITTAYSTTTTTTTVTSTQFSNTISKTKHYTSFEEWSRQVWTKPTLFDRLDDNKISWRVYAHQLPLSESGNTKFTFSLTYFIHGFYCKKAKKLNPIEKFYQDLGNGCLPQYSFLEPNYFGQHNDQHPSAAKVPHSFGSDERTHLGTVLLGEELIWQVYTAVKNSAYKDKVLLVITHDEHGGCFDHVPPPNTVAPDECDGQLGFDFKRLGVRVPMVMISSYIHAMLDFSAY